MHVSLVQPWLTVSLCFFFTSAVNINYAFRKTSISLTNTATSSQMSTANVIPRSPNRLTKLRQTNPSTLSLPVPTKRDIPSTEHPPWKARPRAQSFSHQTSAVMTRPNARRPPAPATRNIEQRPPRTPTRRRIAFYHKHRPYYGFTNFSPHRVKYQGKEYPTSEHLFQSFKVSSLGSYIPIMRKFISPFMSSSKNTSLAWLNTSVFAAPGQMMRCQNPVVSGQKFAPIGWKWILRRHVVNLWLDKYLQLWKYRWMRPFGTNSISIVIYEKNCWLQAMQSWSKYVWNYQWKTLIYNSNIRILTKILFGELALISKAVMSWAKHLKGWGKNCVRCRSIAAGCLLSLNTLSHLFLNCFDKRETAVLKHSTYSSSYNNFCALILRLSMPTMFYDAGEGSPVAGLVMY